MAEDKAFSEGHFYGREVLPYFDVSLVKTWLSMCLRSHNGLPLTGIGSFAIPKRLVQIAQGGHALVARLSSPLSD